MERIAIENKGKMPMWVAGQMIPAGEIRHFDKTMVPREHWPQEEAPAEEEVVDPFKQLLEHNVKTVVAALETMSREDLKKLGEMEQAGAGRRGVLGPIAEKLLSQASTPGAVDPVTAKALEISALSKEQFDALTEGEQGNYLNAAKAALAVPATQAPE
jgi:hypothetical protein